MCKSFLILFLCISVIPGFLVTLVDPKVPVPYVHLCYYLFSFWAVGHVICSFFQNCQLVVNSWAMDNLPNLLQSWMQPSLHQRLSSDFHTHKLKSNHLWNLTIWYHLDAFYCWCIDRETNCLDVNKSQIFDLRLWLIWLDLGCIQNRQDPGTRSQSK